MRPRPGHIPGLDGLRALAILAVLVYHYLPAALPGGYLGVDIFFVVSGFLITTLLLREIDNRGRIDLLNFWRRRARRLVPALVLVVLTAVAAARLVGGDLLVGIGRQTLGALTFTSNWLEVGAGASYFHSTSPILFVNFWSLAVEEQFYLLWPLALVVVLAVGATTRARLTTVVGIGLVSTLLMAVLYTPGADATRVYYGTDTHLMGLMFGAAFAIAWADPRLRGGLHTAAWERWRGWAVLGALLTLVALMRFTHDGMAFTFRGGIALAAVATVVLIAGSLERGGPWRRLMSARPLTWVGERSYGLYLWHWPVIVLLGALLPYAEGTGRAWLVITLSLAITLVMVELSLRLVERPVRRLGFRGAIRSLAAWLRTPWERSRLPRLVGAGLAVLVLVTAVALITAPEKSATQRQIEATEARLAENGSDAGAADGAGAGTDGGSTEIEGLGAAERGSSLGAGIGAAETDATDDAGSADSNEDSSDDSGTEDEATDDSTDLPEGAVEVNGSVYHPDEADLLVPSGDEITAIGDSLVVTSADGLTYRFGDLNFLAKSNRQIGEVDQAIATGVADGSVRDNVILHVGTNAGLDAEGLERALDALGPDRNVVVMDLYVRSTFVDDSNATIREVVAGHPNAVVGEWAEAAAANPGDLQSDRVHPDIDGMHLYADVVAHAFDALAARG